MFKHFLRRSFVVFLMVGFVYSPMIFAATKKTTILKPCTQCHEAEPNLLRGKLKSVSRKAKTMQLFMGSATWQVTYDDETKLDGAKAFNKIGKDKEIAVTYAQKGKVFVASEVEVKQAADIPAEWIIDAKGMAKLIADNKGKLALFDARPGKFFPEGHIEGAVSNYDAKFAKNVAKLPKDKNQLVVFYCGGPT
jgi:hypothetical protein